MPDRWVRPMPSFAITDHPQLRRREDTYQDFLIRITGDGIRMAGVRVYESIQRLSAFQQNYHSGILFQPIYDWRDTDVWRFIADRELDFPETYLHLYQTGSSRPQMRISQFFSIDTARSLVRMSEYEPGLMDRIIRREPNAYLASLYWDSDMFRATSSAVRRTEGGVAEEKRDFRRDTLELLKVTPDPGDAMKVRNHRNVRRAVLRNSTAMLPEHWRMAFQILEAGDPKDRTYRALLSSIGSASKGYK